MGDTNKAIETSRGLYAKNPKSYGAAWRFARASFFLAHRTNDKKKKSKIGYEGYEAGVQAQKLNPKGAEGFYWGACALGEYGMSAGIVRAISKGIGGKIKKMLTRAYNLDRHSSYAGPSGALGRYWYMIPWPMKDLEKSIKYLEEAVRLAPLKLRHHAHLADAYLADERTDLAMKHFKICAGGDPDKEEYLDGVEWKRYCKNKLKELKSPSP
ncbi:MAG: hypothetical protein GY854_25660 [Deltaproteobacteria bacterium]|nr:hypothetical protein [Deltaproteobacteria bacterium]